MRRKSVMALVAICVATMMLVCPAAAGNPENPEGPVVSVLAGETWVVTETTELTGLIIYKDAAVTAEDGYSLTLTVNGVETP
ncbi:MAG: hypothetical protein PVI54_20490, partial [Desulfobacteraceae bacterium]